MFFNYTFKRVYTVFKLFIYKKCINVIFLSQISTYTALTYIYGNKCNLLHFFYYGIFSLHRNTFDSLIILLSFQIDNLDTLGCRYMCLT